MKKFLSALISCSLFISVFAATNCQNCFATCQSKRINITGGKLISNVWRSTLSFDLGNTRQWDFRVSAVYDGNSRVKRIRTSFRGSASLRNSASISMGVSNSGVNAGGGSSWQNINTIEKYWENTNGAKSASYRSNLVVTPARDYRLATIAVTNTATVVLANDVVVRNITAGV